MFDPQASLGFLGHVSFGQRMAQNATGTLDARDVTLDRAEDGGVTLRLSGTGSIPYHCAVHLAPPKQRRGRVHPHHHRPIYDDLPLTSDWIAARIGPT